MPTKQSVIQAAQRREAEQKTKQLYDDIQKKIPDYLKNRIGQASPIGDSISGGYKFADWGAFKVTSDGDLSLSYNHGEAANRIRKEKANKTAMDLHDKYGEKFWDRKYTKTIAQYAGVNSRTIRNYRQRVQSQNGKAKRIP